MSAAEYDDAEGTRVNVEEDGAITIERYDRNEPPVVLTQQEALDVATSVIDRNTPEDLDGKRFCEDCGYHWPEGKCKKLLERPETIVPELVFRQADCKQINRGFNCGYYRPRKEKQ